MTTPPIYQAHSVDDLLNLIPTLFGFVPTESLIGICVSGSRSRFGFRLRIDIPSEANLDETAALVAHHLERGEGERVILIGISKDHAVAGKSVAAVTQRLESKDVEFAVWTDGVRWWSDTNREGTLWNHDPFHESIVTAISNGQAILENRDCVAQEFSETPQALSIAELERIQHEFDVFRERDQSDSVARGISFIELSLGKLAAGQTLSPKDAAYVSMWLRNMLVRDHFWFEIEHSNSRQLLQMWSEVAQALSGPWRCVPLSLAAFCAWQAGDGVRAMLASDAALAVDPNYRLAVLMRRVTTEGLPPNSWRAMRRSFKDTA